MDIIDFTERTDWLKLTEQKELLLELSNSWQEWVDGVDERKSIYTDYQGNFDEKGYNKNTEWITPRLDKINGIINFIDNIQDMMVDEYGFKSEVIYPKLEQDG